MDRADSGRRPLDVMCHDIVERDHAALRRSLTRIGPELSALAAASESPAARAMREVFAELTAVIAGHLAKEEHLVFPALVALSAAKTHPCPRPGTFTTVLYPIRLLESEHLRIEEMIDRLRDLARTIGEPGCISEPFRRCMAELADLDRHLREEHRVENEILFPYALELERQLL